MKELPESSPFPDPSTATEEGIVAVGGDLEPRTLLAAYRHGIFPWPISARLPLVWFSPPERAVLQFDQLHVPRSLARARRRATESIKEAGIEFSIDRDFAAVIRACAKIKREGQKAGTWITPAMIQAYIRLHELGHAHSVEVWKSEKLIGGIYGVDAGGAFAGESMFHRAPNASKFALLHLASHLRERGLAWMDIQVMTPHLEALGAKVISRDAFLRELAKTLKHGLKLF